MGGGKSIEYVDRVVYQTEKVIQYITNPELQSRLYSIQNELSKYKDAKQFKQVVQDLKLSFLKDLPNMTLKPMIQRQSNKEWHIAFTGKTSAGKSSLLNKLYGKRLKKKLRTALGRCTEQPEIVLQEGNIRIWDVQGFDNAFDFTGQALTFLNSIDTVCVLYDGQIDDVADLTQVLWALNKQVLHVRTKCDNCDQDCENSIDQQVQRDLEDIMNLPNSRKSRVFATSKRGQFDNQKLIDYFDK